MTLSILVSDGDGAMFDAMNGLRSTLSIAGSAAHRVLAVIVLGENLDTTGVGPGGLHDVDPGLVIVDAEDDEENLFSLLCHEPEHARGSAAALSLQVPSFARRTSPRC